MTLLESIKKNGLRKMTWGLIALGAILLPLMTGKLKDDYFRECFIALCGFVMGANYGEHREKAKGQDAAAPAPAPTEVAK